MKMNRMGRTNREKIGTMTKAKTDNENTVKKNATAIKGRRRKTKEHTTAGSASNTTGFQHHPLDEVPSLSKNVTFLSAEFATEDSVLIEGLLGCGTGRL